MEHDGISANFGSGSATGWSRMPEPGGKPLKRNIPSLLGLLALLITGVVSAAESPAKPVSLAVAAAAGPTAAAGKGIRTIYLVRHGYYTADSTADPNVGPGLAPLGREQAANVGRYLATLPVKFESLTSSMLTRARETADIMALTLHMRVNRDSLWNECGPRSENPAQNRGDTEAEILASDAQLEAAWAKYMRPSPEADTHDVIVAHGNVIRWMVAKTVAGDTKKWGTMDIAHCSLTVLTVRPDGSVRLVMYSNLGDLPLEQQTWAGRGAGWVKTVTGMK